MFVELKEIASLIESGSYTKEVRRILRAVRFTFGLRRKLTAPLLSAFLHFALQPGSEAHSSLSSFLPKVHSTTFSLFSSMWLNKTFSWLLIDNSRTRQSRFVSL